MLAAVLAIQMGYCSEEKRAAIYRRRLEDSHCHASSAVVPVPDDPGGT